MRVKKSVIAAGLALAAIGTAASAATVNVASTVNQSGFVGLQTGGTYPLTDPATPYNFVGQTNGLNNVTSIDSITVTVTSIFDGDTGPGDFDENNLFLTLDGINTGLALNGLPNNAIQSLTLSQPNPALQALLIAALQDGVLVGGILDTDADGPVGDIISIPGILETTLELTLTGNLLAGPGNGGPGGPGGQVPLPAAALVAPLGALVAGKYSKRFRKAK